MEEKKIINMKAAAKSDTAAPQRLSYEDLNKACAELSQQNQQMHSYIQKLHKQLQEMDVAIQGKRLDYLFKVVEMSLSPSNLYKFDDDFVLKCISEIRDSLTIPEDEDAGDVQEKPAEE